MKKKIVSVLITGAMLISMLAGCATSGGSSAAAPASTAAGEAAGNTIKIGVSGPTTGDSAAAGVRVNIGIDMAIAEINAEGGIEIDGEKRLVEAVYYDTGSDAQTGLSNGEKLITGDKVDFLWCEAFNSAVGVATMELAKKYDIPMATLEPVSSAISEKVLADPDSYKYFFKFGWDSAEYGNTCANTVLKLVEEGKMSLPNKTIALAGDETDYARSNLEAVAAMMKDAGYTVVTEDYWDFGSTDLYAAINDIKGSGADIIFSCSTTPATGVAMIKQMRENGMEDTYHMAIYYPGQPEFEDQIGSQADGLIWAPMLIDMEDETIKAFADKLEAFKSGELVTFDHIDGYSDMMVVLQAMKKAGSLSGEAIATALLDEAGYDVPKGHIVFDKSNHTILSGEGYVAVNAAQIQDGKSSVIYPASVAKTEYIPIK